jgi:hypothetical protein
MSYSVYLTYLLNKRQREAGNLSHLDVLSAMISAAELVKCDRQQQKVADEYYLTADQKVSISGALLITTARS